MAIKVLFPESTTSITLAPLYQWDYGQELEIEATSLPSVIEVHFACKGMNEAIVHTCSSVNNIATVAIPDKCLEQSNDITAWVYEIGDTSGRTIYSITIPITARTRPARSESIPQSVQDTYTQLITAVNGLLDELTQGSVNVGYAVRAGVANSAVKATAADTATNANTAGNANSAIWASNDFLGNPIHSTYMKIPTEYTELKYGDTLPFGLYHFFIVRTPGSLDDGHSFVVDLGSKGYYPLHVYSPLMGDMGGGFQRVAFTFTGSVDRPGYEYTAVQHSWIEQHVSVYGLNFGNVADSDIFAIYYNKLTN